MPPILDNEHDPERVDRLRVKAMVNIGLLAIASNRTPRQVMREIARGLSPDTDWHESQRDAFVDTYARARWHSDSTVKDVVA